eukprot:419378-Heterocapsa_arctica.AAC.1
MIRQPIFGISIIPKVLITVNRRKHVLEAHGERGQQAVSVGLSPERTVPEVGHLEAKAAQCGHQTHIT